MTNKKGKQKEAEKDEESAILYRLFICMGRNTKNKCGHGCKHTKRKVMESFFYYFLYMFIKEENLQIKILKTGVKLVGGWILY